MALSVRKTSIKNTGIRCHAAGMVNENVRGWPDDINNIGRDCRAEMEQLEDVARHKQGAKRSRAQLEVEERFGEAFGVPGAQTRGNAGLKRSRNV